MLSLVLHPCSPQHSDIWGRRLATWRPEWCEYRAPFQSKQAWNLLLDCWENYWLSELLSFSPQLSVPSSSFWWNVWPGKLSLTLCMHWHYCCQWVGHAGTLPVEGSGLELTGRLSVSHAWDSRFDPRHWKKIQNQPIKKEATDLESQCLAQLIRGQFNFVSRKKEKKKQ